MRRTKPLSDQATLRITLRPISANFWGAPHFNCRPRRIRYNANIALIQAKTFQFQSKLDYLWRVTLVQKFSVLYFTFTSRYVNMNRMILLIHSVLVLNSGPFNIFLYKSWPYFHFSLLKLYTQPYNRALSIYITTIRTVLLCTSQNNKYCYLALN